MATYKSHAIQLYKNLLYLGRDYPKGHDYFRTRLKAAFMKNREVAESPQLEMLLARGQYIIKELEALYMLKKYRTLKKRYYTKQ
ncbi:electron transfer flavoprotein regulatory factor 1-like [Tachypleus tridentatus]|uniref:electron transfer flavoprotein regulatory factor 1-like n=1 Tax=Tachypleus tridentatus TaxID=6853 RepID=UPI003FD1495A